MPAGDSAVMEILPLQCQCEPSDHRCAGKGCPSLLVPHRSKALLTCQERGLGWRKSGSCFPPSPFLEAVSVLRRCFIFLGKGGSGGEQSQVLELAGSTAKWSLAQCWPRLLALSQTIPRHGHKKSGCSHSTLMSKRV